MPLKSSTNGWYARAHVESDQHPLGPIGLETELREFGDPTTSPEARTFAAARGLSTGPFERMGAKVSGQILAFPCAAGVKFRRMDTGRRWSRGRFLRHPLNIFYGSEPYARVLVAESETDSAALLALYPDHDVAVMPLGAACWSPIWTAQLAEYPVVGVALDNDEAGEDGAAKIGAAVPQAVRHAAPDGAKDWSEWVAGNGTGDPPRLSSSSLRKDDDDDSNSSSSQGALRTTTKPRARRTKRRRLADPRAWGQT